MAKSKKELPKEKPKKGEEAELEYQGGIEAQDGGASDVVAGGSSIVVSTGSVSFSSYHQEKEVDRHLVKILVKYPDDYKKKKYFTDGEIKEVSPESAKIFIDQKIATLVDAD